MFVGGFVNFYFIYINVKYKEQKSDVKLYIFYIL